MNTIRTIVAILLAVFCSLASAEARTIKFGDKGQDVKALQRNLGVTPTGEVHKKTHSAVKAFQKKNGLPQTGNWGPLSQAKWESLKNKKVKKTVAKKTDQSKPKSKAVASTPAKPKNSVVKKAGIPAVEPPLPEVDQKIKTKLDRLAVELIKPSIPESKKGISRNSVQVAKKDTQQKSFWQKLFGKKDPKKSTTIASNTAGRSYTTTVRLTYYNGVEGSIKRVPVRNKKGKIVRYRTTYPGTDYYTKVQKATSALGRNSLIEPKPGRIGVVAVDKNRIPLGSRIDIHLGKTTLPCIAVDRFHTGKVYAALEKTKRRMRLTGELARVRDVVDVCSRRPLPLFARVTITPYRGNFMALSMIQRWAHLNLKPSKSLDSGTLFASGFRLAAR